MNVSLVFHRVMLTTHVQYRVNVYERIVSQISPFYQTQTLAKLYVRS